MAGQGSKLNKAKGRRRSKTSYRAGANGVRITERNKVARLSKYLKKNPGDKDARIAFERFGGNTAKLPPIPKDIPEKQHVLFGTVTYSKMKKGEKQKPASYLRDFHASYMTPKQLHRGVIRASRKMQTSVNKAMYYDQRQAYLAMSNTKQA